MSLWVSRLWPEHHMVFGLETMEVINFALIVIFSMGFKDVFT